MVGLYQGSGLPSALFYIYIYIYMNDINDINKVFLFTAMNRESSLFAGPVVWTELDKYWNIYEKKSSIF